MNQTTNLSTLKINKFSSEEQYKQAFEDELIGEFDLNLTPDLSAGQKVEAGGEIFNDYTNNQAKGQHSHAEGYETCAGTKGYYISHIIPATSTSIGKIYLTKDDTKVPTWNEEPTSTTSISAPAWDLETETHYFSVQANGYYQWPRAAKITGFDEATGCLEYRKVITEGQQYWEGTSDRDKKPFFLFVDTWSTWGAISKGEDAHAEGRETLAAADQSHAEGEGTKAIGRYGHSEGVATVAGYAAHAEGLCSVALGLHSHSEGYTNESLGKDSHSEGRFTKAHGEQAHTEGLSTIASGNFGSHAEGNSTRATNNGSHAEGYSTEASGKYSHAEGYGTTASGDFGSHAEGNSTRATINGAHAEGRNTEASGRYSHAEGEETKATNSGAHAEGYRTQAQGVYSHAEGYQTYAAGAGSHIEGGSSNLYAPIVNATNDDIQIAWQTKKFALAKGTRAHAEGQDCLALGNYSHAEGNYTQAIGDYSHAEGYRTLAERDYSHAEGHHSHADGHYAHAEGDGSHAEGTCAHAEGYYTHAQSLQHVQGTLNIDDDSAAFIIGNGSGDEGTQSNALTVDWQGNITHAEATQSTTGADYAEYFEWKDGNPEDEDRVGYIVTLEGEKIRLAESTDEDILGVISGTAAVIGDTASWDWAGKYQVDEYGRTIWEDVEEFIDIEEQYEVMIEETVESIDEEGNTITETTQVPKTETRTIKKSLGFFPRRKLAPDYDNTQLYIPRSKRKEWDTVGLMGKLHVRDDGTCVPGAYATVGEPGIATFSSTKTNMRVMKRINDHVVLVLMK